MEPLEGPNPIDLGPGREPLRLPALEASTDPKAPHHDLRRFTGWGGRWPSSVESLEYKEKSRRKAKVQKLACEGGPADMIWEVWRFS